MEFLKRNPKNRTKVLLPAAQTNRKRAGENAMKKKTIRWVILLAVLLCATAWLLFLVDRQVAGQEIVSVSEISASCTVTVSKYRYIPGNERKEYILSAEQIQKLQTLILNSSFTKTHSSSIQYFDSDIYDIQVEFDRPLEPLSICCIGNEYISIRNQFGGKYLKIQNPQWKDTLEMILEN